MEWFEEWFDSPLYEKLYAHRNKEEAARLGELIQKVIPVRKYPKILDLGCGRGRHSVYLAALGYTVTGIDLSGEAIEKARQKAEENKLQNINFEIQDMREPMNETFDAVINLFTTFGYFQSEKENVRVIEAQAKVLRKDGKLMIDFMNVPRVKETFEPESEGQFGNIHYHVKRSLEEDVIKKKIEFTGPVLNGKKTYYERVKLYEPEWFISALTKRGFLIEKVFGNYEGADYHRKSSERLIIVALKR